ncbi:MAG: acyltransferase, partial [Muribaculaceae bacterium]
WGGMSVDQTLHDLAMLPLNFPSMGGHLWFMYPLISIYLIMPIVSPWLERASAREELTFVLLFVASTFVPWIHQWVSPDIWGECFWNHYSMLWYCSGYLGYLVLAHYLRHHLAWSVKRKMVVGALCFVAGSVFTAWAFWWQGVPGEIVPTTRLEWSWEFCTPNVLCATFGAFLMFSCISVKRPPRLIAGLSRLSFGMYLVHLFFLAPIASSIVAGDQTNPLLPVWIAIPVIAVLSYVASALTAKLVSYLPGSKWIIG